jgi:hypothetical protein
MSRLEDRLSGIERRLDEIQALLVHLINLQTGDTAPDPDELEVSPADVQRLIDEHSIDVEYDPLEIQYEMAKNWAASGREDDLTEFDLSGRNLRGVDLKDATLTRAVLAKADLTGAKLQRANLTDTDISRARLDRADLSKATLEEADLTFAHMTYCKLDSASLRYALLTRANLVGANLANTDLGGAQLSRAILTRANLKGAQVTYRQLAAVSALDGATMPDGRLFDGDYHPYADYAR